MGSMQDIAADGPAIRRALLCESLPNRRLRAVVLHVQGLFLRIPRKILQLGPTSWFFRNSHDLMSVLISPHAVSPVAAPDLSRQALPSVLTRLRLETRHEHSAAERALDLMDSALTPDTYGRRLAQFYGFYAPLEAALKTRCGMPEGRMQEPLSCLAALFPRLNKSRLLRQDLLYLQINADSLPLCRDLPPLQTKPQVLGCVYVLEGATLGGRVITQHVQATLGITAATGGSFFEGYAGDTARMWQTMRQTLLSGAVDTRSENAMVASAIATFACLRGYCAAAGVQAISNDGGSAGSGVTNGPGWPPANHERKEQRA